MNMYVSNLSFHTGDDGLKSLFEAHGKVASAKVIRDRESGSSRGFGFVEMPDENEASDAMKKLNGVEIEGRAISVTAARPKNH